MKDQILVLLLLPETGNLLPLSSSSLQEINILKAKLVAYFLILTASEMQIDFASDQLFSLCFWVSFLRLHKHLCADQ